MTPRPRQIRPTFARVDPDALAHNLRVVQRHVGARCRVLAVVKADGYGHGAVTAARAFLGAGAWGLAVNLVEEGAELREAGVRAPILVLGGVYPGTEEVLVHKRLTPVVWAPAHLQLLSAAARRAGVSSLPVHVKIDTGMSRLGVLVEELGGLLDWIEADRDRVIEVEGLMTHLACADELEDDVSPRQLARFEAARQLFEARGLRPKFRHACNSAGLARLRHAHFDMVRPGIALYGAAASRHVILPDLKMTISLHSRVIGIRELPAGARVSYGHRATLTRPSRLGVVPVGYADGYRRRMSGQAEVLVRGRRCRVVGTITMDTVLIDLTDLPGARAGERVTLLGQQGRQRVDAYELAEWAGVIPYEIMCGLSKRVPRR